MENELLFFYGTECEHCEKMMPLIEQLEKELGMKLTRYEVWHSKENSILMDQYDKELCGGVPFFYNTKSHTWLCGEVSYEILKKWTLS